MSEEHKPHSGFRKRTAVVHEYAMLGAGVVKRRREEALTAENEMLGMYEGLQEQLETLRLALGLVSECEDTLTEDGYAYLVFAANEALGSNPATSSEREPGRDVGVSTPDSQAVIAAAALTGTPSRSETSSPASEPKEDA